MYHKIIQANNNFASLKINNMRQVITAKDIQLYFGKKESMSFKMIKSIRKELGKKQYQPITIEDFCAYYGVSKESIVSIILENETKKSKDKNKQSDKSKVLVVSDMQCKEKPISSGYSFSTPTH